MSRVFTASTWAFVSAAVERGWSFVYGGTATGLMGVLADAVADYGGEVVGVLCESAQIKAHAHPELTKTEILPTLSARKQRFVELSDAFVVLPGGIGTMDELFEVAALAQIGAHNKPILLLNIAGYYNGLLAFLGRAQAEGFAPPLAWIVVSNPLEALAQIENLLGSTHQRGA